MKRLTTACLVLLSGLMSLAALKAQDDSPPPTVEAQMLTESPDEMAATLEPVLTAEIIATLEIALPTVEVTSEGDRVSPESTAEITPVSLTQAVIILPTQEPGVTLLAPQIPTSTATPALRTIEGKALYPNRVLGQAFIRVQAFAPDDTLLSTVYTDATGRYALVTLADQVTRIEIEAPLYLPETLYIAPGLAPETRTLRGGDLDSDACVGKADIAILVQHYGETFVGADLDGSGVVDVIDLTLLSGNYDETCIPDLVIASPESPVLMVTVESVSTEEVSATELPLPPTQIPATEEAVPIVEISPTEEAVPTVEISPIEALPLPTDNDIPAEPTMEATVSL